MIDYIEEHTERFLAELFDWLRLPSVSADAQFREGMRQAAHFLKSRLEEAGLAQVEVCPTAGYPLVYGEKLIDPARPTVLVYGHYDVQPADPYEQWVSPPFEPQIRDGAIYARGASDDKGQVYMHVKALEVLAKTSGLPCNVKFLVEGEEEINTNNLRDFINANQAKLRADVVLISDTSMLADDCPTLKVGVRGISYHEVEVTGPNRDLHSGLYGGAVANPITILCRLIAGLHDEHNRITIPGFYDKVEQLNAQQRAELNQVAPSDDEFKRAIGLPAIYGEEGYTTLERIGIRPALDVHGIWGGYTGEGAKSIIAAKAYAKLSMRLVPHQTSPEISRLFQQHFALMAPAGVTVQVTCFPGSEPSVLPTDSVGYQAAAQALETTFGRRPVPVRSGGSLPVVTLFKTALGLDSVLLGFGLDTDAIHSPNEHFSIARFLRGIETICCFYRNYAAAIR